MDPIWQVSLQQVMYSLALLKFDIISRIARIESFHWFHWVLQRNLARCHSTPVGTVEVSNLQRQSDALSAIESLATSDGAIAAVIAAGRVPTGRADMMLHGKIKGIVHYSNHCFVDLLCILEATRLESMVASSVQSKNLP